MADNTDGSFSYEDAFPSPSAKKEPAKEFSYEDAYGIKPERSALGEVATGIKRGIIGGIPEAAGKAMQWATDENATGLQKQVYDTGKGLADRAKARLELPENKLNPEAHGAVTNAFAEGGEMLGPSIAFPAAAGAAMVGLPVKWGLARGAYDVLTHV